MPLGATFLDEDGTERPIVMGCYGIGPGRIMAAAVEQRHDEHGIAWPPSLAPYDVHVVAIGAAGAGGVEIAERAAERRSRRRASPCCSTTATCRPGEKFADADLIGCPVRVTVGKKTLEDGQRRRARPRPTGRRSESPVEALADHVRRSSDGTKAPLHDRALRRDDPALMAEQGVTYRGLAAKTGLSAGYLNHLVHGNRPVPSNDVIATLAKALEVEPEHFREYRIRVITERLEDAGAVDRSTAARS